MLTFYSCFFKYIFDLQQCHSKHIKDLMLFSSKLRKLMLSSDIQGQQVPRSLVEVAGVDVLVLDETRHMYLYSK